MSEDRKIMIDDQEYLESEMSEKARYIIAQIDSVRGTVSELQFRLDQAAVTERAFGEMLTEALTEEADAPEGELAEKIVS